MVAPTGARRSKADHPGLPISVAEIAASAAACQAAGAEALHLHVRDVQGQHTLDAGRYREAIAELRHAAPGMAIQITTEAAGMFGPSDQLACLAALRPDWASLAPREIKESSRTARQIYAQAADQGTRLQHILHAPADLDLLLRWRALGWVPDDSPEVIAVLGRYAPARAASPQDVDDFLVQPGAGLVRWSFCAFGATEPVALAHAAPRADWLRVGFENNIHDDHGQVLPDNAASVRALQAALVAQVTE